MPVFARRVALVLAVSAFGWVVLQNAWVCDDAWFCLRPAWHLVHGFGLRSDVAERVQGFTSPLWTLLLAGLLATGADAWLGAILLSAGLALAGAALLGRVGGGRVLLGPLGVALLAGSRAFVDYSSSGLENPLAHLLYLGFLLAWLAPRRADPWLPAALAGLLALTRLDLGLLATPALAWMLGAPERPGDRARVLLGLLPAALWAAFALVYYGHPLPNTALVKLDGGGLARAVLAERGLWYLADSAAWDPLLGPVLALGALAGFGRAARPLLASLGLLLYLGYLVWIGGDFMLGRFLSVPFCGAALLFVWALRRRSWALHAPALAVVIALALLDPGSPARTGAEVALRDPLAERETRFDVRDERLWYYAETGLFARIASGGSLTDPEPAPPGPAEVRVFAGGRASFFAGPSLHIVPSFGLTDALVARMPPAAPGQLRAGHVHRVIPRGYLESLRTGENRIADPRVRPLLDDLWLVTRGPLWTRARWAAILRLNTGCYDGLRALPLETEP